MSKSFKFKDDIYLDSSSIVYGHSLLSDRLKRLGLLQCVNKSTDSNRYADFNITYDSGNNFDRRVYFYMSIENNETASAGIFGYANGRIDNHTQLAGKATVTVNSDKTIRITLVSNWASIILIGAYSYPIS